MCLQLKAVDQDSVALLGWRGQPKGNMQIFASATAIGLPLASAIASWKGYLVPAEYKAIWTDVFTISKLVLHVAFLMNG